MERKIRSKSGHKVMNLNRRISIFQKCLDCSGWSYKDATNCPFSECQLHPFRTGKGTQISADRNKAIRAYCLDCMNGQVGEVTKCPSSECPLFVYRRGVLETLPNSYPEVVPSKKVLTFNRPCSPVRFNRVSAPQNGISGGIANALRS